MESTRDELVPKRVDECIVFTYHMDRDISLYNQETDESRVFEDAEVIAVVIYRNDHTVIKVNVKSRNQDDLKVAEAVSPVLVPYDAIRAAVDSIVYEQIIGIDPPENDRYEITTGREPGRGEDGKPNREFLI